MIRLFVGVGLPADVRMRLSALGSGVPGARWVPPENLHLTLRFIGEVTETDAEDIHDILAGIRTKAFDIALAGVGHFESKGQVHTLWAGIDKNPELTALRDRIESALVRFGLEPEERRYTPHVTLARLRDTSVHRVQAFLTTNALFRAGPVPVDRFTLFSSYLQGSGAIYAAEAEYPLTGAWV